MRQVWGRRERPRETRTLPGPQSLSVVGPAAPDRPASSLGHDLHVSARYALLMSHDGRMPDFVGHAIDRLRAAGIEMSQGLSDQEVARVQNRFNFRFGPEHLDFIQSAVPVGDSWPEWRNGSGKIQGLLAWPVEGTIFDVLNNDFWPVSWSERPDAQDEREHLARARMVEVPRLVPVFAHRYLASGTQSSPSPVFSVHQTDVIFYGDNLLDYVAREFGAPPLSPSHRFHVPFWSDLAGGAENRDM